MHVKNFDDTQLEFPKGRDEIYIWKVRQYSQWHRAYVYSIHGGKTGMRNFDDFVKYKLAQDGTLNVQIPTGSEHFNLHVSNVFWPK